MPNNFQCLALLAKRVQEGNPKMTYRQARNRVFSLEQQWQQEGNQVTHLYPDEQIQPGQENE